jgi:hypothetical protein
MLSVFGVGIGIAAAAIGVLRLVSTKRRSDFGVGRFVALARSWLNGRRLKGTSAPTSVGRDEPPGRAATEPLAKGTRRTRRRAF